MVGQAGKRSEKTAIIHVHGGWFIWGTAHKLLPMRNPLAVAASRLTFVPPEELVPARQPINFSGMDRPIGGLHGHTGKNSTDLRLGLATRRDEGPRPIAQAA
jgi:hypothetical protein